MALVLLLDNVKAGALECGRQMGPSAAYVFEWRRLRRILLRLDDDPALVADLGERSRKRIVVDAPIARDREHAGKNGIEKTQILPARLREHSGPNVLAMDMDDTV